MSDHVFWVWTDRLLVFDDGPDLLKFLDGTRQLESEIGAPADMLRETVHEGECNDGADPGSVARFFGALANPARLRLMEFICAGEHTIGECVDHLHLSRGQVSGHLRYLADAGYLQPSRRGDQVYYQVATTQTSHLMHLARALARDNAVELDCCSRIDQEQ
ncbi:ArsR/SmtB family transcription factor [Actinomadura nitritigenes]|uniref:ArsR/SmtB family transcription factor n=1 Tax=Actinomadura nitritigenes TaxID=134602 RepID=UPI003D8CA99C